MNVPKRYWPGDCVRVGCVAALRVRYPLPNIVHTPRGASVVDNLKRAMNDFVLATGLLSPLVQTNIVTYPHGT